VSNGYRIAKGASRALKPYIRQRMQFFVAKVNLEAQAGTGLTYLPPLQVAFESEQFMLALRLGMRIRSRRTSCAQPACSGSTAMTTGRAAPGRVHARLPRNR
jgi:hypothetical protein